MLCGKHARGGRVTDDYIYVGMNMHWDGCTFELPQLSEGRIWHVFANTSAPSRRMSGTWERAASWATSRRFLMGPRSVAILVGRVTTAK
jgi:isoamylase